MKPIMKTSWPLGVASILIVAVIYAVGAPADGATNQSHRDDVGPGAREAIKNVLADGKLLRLTMGDDGAADCFRFMVTLVLKTNGNATVPTNYVVARDHHQMAAVVLSGRGDPYAYLTKGFMAGFDPMEPGQLLVNTDGNPRFVFELGKENDLDVELSFLHSIKQPELRIDLNEILRGAIANAGRADYDPQRRIVRMATESSSMLVALPPATAQGQFGIERLELHSRTGAIVVFPGITLGAPPPQIFNIDKGAFEAAGLKTREATQTEPGNVSLLVPRAFGTHPQESLAITRMKAMLPESMLSQKGPTTRPSRGTE
jgi:hypothetical protein